MKKILSISLILINLLSANLALADVNVLSKIRVFYRPDGGVSVMKVIADTCGGLSEKECLDRETQKGNFKNFSYDDVSESDLPQDRQDRDKWRGEKGKGITIDKTLVTKSEKMKELQDKLDAELDQNSPNSVKIIKLQRKLEKLKNMSTKNNLLSSEELAQFADKENQSFIASVVTSVGEVISDIINSIKEGFLALKELVTAKLKVGTAEKPAGITVYDQGSGAPYCLIVENGQFKNIPGECGVSPSSSSNSSSNSGQSGSSNASQSGGNPQLGGNNQSVSASSTLSGTTTPSSIEPGFFSSATSAMPQVSASSTATSTSQ